MFDYPRSLLELTPLPRRARLRFVSCEGPLAGRLPVSGVHRLFANLKRWALGVYHGVHRKHHLQSYLDEFVFPFNRRRTRHAAFRSLLGIVVARKPTTYKMLAGKQRHKRCVKT